MQDTQQGIKKKKIGSINAEISVAQVGKTD